MVAFFPACVLAIAVSDVSALESESVLRGSTQHLAQNGQHAKRGHTQVTHTQQQRAMSGGRLKHAEDSHQVPKVLHRVMLPRADGKLACHQHHNENWDAADFITRFRQDFYAHNSGWTEYIWGADAVKSLVEQSQALFEQHDLADFADVFNNMDQWIYQQDTIRHLILYRFGGVYMDLDVDCKADLFEIIGSQSLVLRSGGKNNFMATAPGQDFSLKMLRRIRDTFKKGLPDERPSAIWLTGEKQICATLKDLDVECWKVSDQKNGQLIANDDISLKLTGSYEVENLSDEAKCSHNMKNSWADQQEVPDAPESEADLAKLCDMLYDERTIWGENLGALIQKLD